MSYIVPSEKPRTCGVCPFARLSQINYGKCWCALDATNTRSYAASFERLDNCPLIEIPTPHGRLGDLDELKTAFPRCDNSMDIKIASVRATINHAPTIIEAEGET